MDPAYTISSFPPPPPPNSCQYRETEEKDRKDGKDPRKCVHTVYVNICPAGRNAALLVRGFSQNSRLFADIPYTV